MIIKNKKLILHEPATSMVSHKTGKILYELVVRDPEEDYNGRDYDKVYTYNEEYGTLKPGAELVLNLQYVSGHLRTVEE